MEAYMKCLIPAFFLTASRRQLLCLQKEVKIYEEMEKQSDFSFLT